MPNGEESRGAPIGSPFARELKASRQGSNVEVANLMGVGLDEAATGWN